MKKKALYNELFAGVFVLLIPLIFVFLLNFFFIGMNFKYWNPIISSNGVLIETIILYTVCVLLLGISRRWKNVIIITGVFLLLLSFVNQMKYSFMEEPVLISDVLYLHNIGESFDIVQGEIWNVISLLILPFIIETLLFIVLILLGNVIKFKFEINNLKTRILMIVLSLLVFIILTLPFGMINKVILNNIYQIKIRKDYNAFTTTTHYYLNYGIIGGIYGQLLEDRIYEPDDYNEYVIKDELLKAKENENKKFGKPNIIVVFSESFWDVQQLDEFEFNKDITSNFNRLKEKGLFFDMISPSYGGISANVEYEFLTGSNVMYFNESYIPYMQLFKKKTYYDRPSIIRELKNNNYRTKITTASSSKLFNCGRFYKYLSVDETEYLNDITDEKYIKGKYLSDEYLTDKIINELETKQKDEKLFYMTLTLQAHMPYPIDKYSDYDVWVTHSKYSKDTNDTITSYAQGIYDADKQLGRLYDYIQTIDEPTIIIFYGDHLPYLNNGKENIINTLEYFNTDNELLNTFRKYNTQSLILTNFEFDKNEEEIKYLGPDLLGVYVLNNMDIEISDYYKWLYNTKDYIGASNYWVTVDNGGNLYHTADLTGEQKRIYNLRRNIEYKLFVK